MNLNPPGVLFIFTELNISKINFIQNYTFFAYLTCVFLMHPMHHATYHNKEIFCWFEKIEKRKSESFSIYKIQKNVCCDPPPPLSIHVPGPQRTLDWYPYFHQFIHSSYIYMWLHPNPAQLCHLANSKGLWFGSVRVRLACNFAKLT